jgi:hypothetical protein
MEIEDVARIRFTSRRPTQQQRELAVCDRVLRKIVVDDQRVPAVVAEIFADGDACVRREKLQRRGLRRRRGER